MKRTDEEIIKDLRNVEGDLSPENLHMDGEASPAYVKKRLRELNARKKALTTELGREATTKEIWGY